MECAPLKAPLSGRAVPYYKTRAFSSGTFYSKQKEKTNQILVYGLGIVESANKRDKRDYVTCDSLELSRARYPTINHGTVATGSAAALHRSYASV